LIGAITAAITIKSLYAPDPAYFGDYQATNARGDYILRIKDEATAIMIFTDKKDKNRYAYRGTIQLDKNKFKVQWTDLRNGEKWEPLPQPVQGILTMTVPGRIETTEGSFSQLAKPLWKRLFF
jgi:hypothetical protein